MQIMQLMLFTIAARIKAERTTAGSFMNINASYFAEINPLKSCL